MMPRINIHLVFKTHLDIGFTDFASRVVENYFSRFIPQAIELARTLRRADSSERFIWTTGSWLIYEYLEQASAQERARMEDAILNGDIAWHGLPFTTHSELMDAALFRYGLRLSQELDRRFGKKTIAAKLTDVPGHTRAIVPLLAEAGIQFLHIGINPGSTPVDVPPVFVWQDSRGAEVLVVYQKGSYGDLTLVPGMEDALAFAHTGDNEAPQSAEQIMAVFREMRARFPGTRVVASTLDAYAQQLILIKPRLPVVTGEMGDTWIHGVGTDPKKVSHYRALCRLRNRWLAEGRVKLDDPGFSAFSRFLLLIPEHTWGLDLKTHLADFTTYAAGGFRAARQQANFKKMEASWAEQRAYLSQAVQSLGQPSLAEEARAMLAEIEPAQPHKDGFTRVSDPSVLFETAHFAIGFDAETGAITCLQEKHSGRNWADLQHPLALFRYETFSHRDYDRFWKQYIVNRRRNRRWALPDFTKPGMEPAGRKHKTWHPRLAEMWVREDSVGSHFVIEMDTPQEAWASYGCPKRLTLEAVFPVEDLSLYLTWQWFDKPACRLPEALWLSFCPRLPRASGWQLEKMGRFFSPHEVLHNGNRKLHAVGTNVVYRDPGGEFCLETLDAPLVAPGEPSLLNFNNRLPPLKKGMHFNLYNNVWGTNFPMWYEEDARFRFVLRVTHDHSER